MGTAPRALEGRTPAKDGPFESKGGPDGKASESLDTAVQGTAQLVSSMDRPGHRSAAKQERDDGAAI